MQRLTRCFRRTGKRINDYVSTRGTTKFVIKRAPGRDWWRSLNYTAGKPLVKSIIGRRKISEMETLPTMATQTMTLSRLPPMRLTLISRLCLSFGVFPSLSPLASELAALPHAEAFKERLRFYLTLVPADRDDYAKIVTRLRSTTGSVGRWDYYLANYDAVYSQIMSEKVERILSSLTVPSVSISGGDRTIADTDDSAGETVGRFGSSNRYQCVS